MDTATTNDIIGAACAIGAPVLVGIWVRLEVLFDRKMKIDLTANQLATEQNMAAALQSGLQTGAGIYAMQGTQAAVAYVEKAVPEAVAHYALTSPDIGEKLVGKAVAAGIVGAVSLTSGLQTTSNGVTVNAGSNGPDHNSAS